MPGVVLVKVAAKAARRVVGRRCGMADTRAPGGGAAEARIACRQADLVVQPRNQILGLCSERQRQMGRRPVSLEM
eukprot:scaffold7055_cov254-Pinguiococcus_pyrenoidosus.AAC.8